MNAELCFGLGLGALLTGNAFGQAHSRPNIIVLMTDQQRYDALHCAGNPAILTPNLDKLAQDGNLFCNAYSSTPSSTPARAGLLTGMSPWNHGMLGYGDEAERYEYEFPRLMKELGYYTMGIGKMHWYPQTNTRGFDALLTDESGRKMTPDFISDYRKWFAVTSGGLNPDSTGIGWNEHRAGVYVLPEEWHPTSWTGHMAVEAIRNYRNAKPLYLKVSFARPHSPYDPPKRVCDKYAGQPLPEAPAMGDWIPEEWKKETDPTKNKNAAIGNYGKEYAQNSRRHYYASVTFIDEQIGLIIDELKRKGLYDNSLIFFISDHGDMLGDHCLWRKTYAYEGSSGIPFIVKLPAGCPSCYEKGSRIDKVVELRDVLPTVLDLNGQEQPARMDGLSLLRLYRGEGDSWRKYLDLEHSTAYFRDNSWCALTDGHVKYIYFTLTGEEQFFDLDKDPHENVNLVKSGKYRKRVEALREAMVGHLGVRGEEWVKDGRLQVMKRSVLYGKNFPYDGDPYKRPQK